MTLYGFCFWDLPDPEDENALVAVHAHTAAAPGEARSCPFCGLRWGTLRVTTGLLSWPGLDALRRAERRTKAGRI